MCDQECRYWLSVLGLRFGARSFKEHNTIRARYNYQHPFAATESTEYQTRVCDRAPGPGSSSVFHMDTSIAGPARRSYRANWAPESLPRS